mgnify:CR=1 FL=1
MEYPFDEMHKNALISSLELVLMSLGNTKYHLFVAKLGAIHDTTVRECYRKPEYLKAALKEVYQKDYDYIINESKAHLHELANEKDIASFFQVMES